MAGGKVCGVPQPVATALSAPQSGENHHGTSRSWSSQAMAQPKVMLLITLRQNESVLGLRPNSANRLRR